MLLWCVHRKIWEEGTLRGILEVVAFEAEIVVEYMKKGLGRVFQIEKSTWATAWWWKRAELRSPV